MVTYRLNRKELLSARRMLLDACIEQQFDEVERIASAVTKCLRAGRTVFACGNGGSACQAEHFAAELVGRFDRDRKSLCALALTASAPIITAVANDYSFSKIFSRQLEGVGRKGDCLLAISTSGNSENVVEACKAARSMGITVCSLTGRGGGKVAAESDNVLVVPHVDTPLIQEMHLIVLHLICQFVEDALSRGSD